MTSDPYQAPSAQIQNIPMGHEGYDESKYYSPTGRFNRSRYICYFFATYLFFYFGLLLLAVIGSSLGNESFSTFIIFPVTIVSFIGMMVLMTIYGIRRLHDMDFTGWLMILAFIPLINFFFFVLLMINKGTVSKNRFGPPQKPSSTVTQVFAWICGLIIPILIIGILAAIAIPQYQQYIQNASGG